MTYEDRVVDVPGVGEVQIRIEHLRNAGGELLVSTLSGGMRTTSSLPLTEDELRTIAASQPGVYYSA